MNKREANQLWRRIERESKTVTVLGLRFWERGSYEISALDAVTGYPFVVRSSEDWDDRQATARLYQDS